jgi:hypothetical protein
MSNILHLQQNLIDIQERINREIQFGEDTQRELVKTLGLVRESLEMLEKQITTLFSDRRASLAATLGQPQEMTIVGEDVLPSLDKVKRVTRQAAE